MIFPKQNLVDEHLLPAERIDQIMESCVEFLGIRSNLLGSKTTYRNNNPNNLIVFNSNLYIKYKHEYIKVWYGDIDITKKYQELIHLYQDIKLPFYILYEMDGRFNNEDQPNIDRHLIRVDSNGIQLGSQWHEYFNPKTLEPYNE